MKKISYEVMMKILVMFLRGSIFFKEVIVKLTFLIDSRGFVCDQDIDIVKNLLLIAFNYTEKHEPNYLFRYKLALLYLLDYGTEAVSENIIMFLKSGRWGIGEASNRPVILENRTVGYTYYLLAEYA